MWGCTLAALRCINSPLGKLTDFSSFLMCKSAYLRCNRFVLQIYISSVRFATSVEQCRKKHHVSTCSLVNQDCVVKVNSPLLGFSKVHVNMVSFSSQSSRWGMGVIALQEPGPHQTQRWQRTDGEVLIFTRTRTSRDHPASALSSHLTNFTGGEAHCLPHLTLRSLRETVEVENEERHSEDSFSGLCPVFIWANNP